VSVGGLTRWLFGFFLSTWGVAVLAALDSSIVFSLPFAIDAAVIILAAQHRDLFWLYPLIVVPASLGGAAITYWIGWKIGEEGLHRFVPRRRLDRVHNRVRHSGAFALAALDLIPPPFPFTPIVLAAGALDVAPRWTHRFPGASDIASNVSYTRAMRSKSQSRSQLRSPSASPSPSRKDEARQSHDITVDTACPLDCPDSCSLSVKINAGRVVSLDGSRRQPTTGGYICAKVRRFAERVHGEARVPHPLMRTGAKGQAAFARISWEEALGAIARALLKVRERWGGEAILPFSYGGSNGLVSQDTTDATLFRRLGASRLLRNVCAAPTGAAFEGLYGRMPSVAYDDYPDARLIVVWGANPSTSGIHLVPYIREAQRRGARLVVIDPRSTPLARLADLHLAVRPGTDIVVALAVHRFLFEEGGADLEFLERHARGADRLRARAWEWPVERAADVSGLAADDLRRFAELYATGSPAVIRCGWGIERNRNGGNAALAILALPAVAGKFGVRGGGYSMSSSGAWKIDRSRWVGAQEPATRTVNMNRLGRALTELTDPPIKALFVYNCNPAVTMPDQNRVVRGLQRDDLFTVVFDQVFTDTALYADIVLPATTFLEGYDVARAYGPLSLQLVQPVVDSVGEARPNSQVFGELLTACDLNGDGEPQGELDVLMHVLDGLEGNAAAQLREACFAVPECGRTPVQFKDVFPATPDGRIDLFPASLAAQAGGQLYVFAPDPATERHPLALISPASDRTISSTLGELSRPEVRLLMHPTDASARGLEDGDVVRIANDLGEVQCPVSVAPAVRPGTVVLPKGLWRKNTRNGSTATALVADDLTDFAGGACFNDARVEVTLLTRRTQ
jgi:anaerobic selenocysteine-containing dehydrogenase/membrane protein YqaA with SNARE-associated domain